MKNRILALLLALCLCLVLAAGCGKQEEAEPTEQPSEPEEFLEPTELENETTEPTEPSDEAETDTPESSEDEAPAQIYRFAGSEEAAELLLAERDYYEGLNQNDLNYRLQKQDATLEELEAYVRTQTLDFTDEEKTAIDEEMAWFLDACESRGYDLPALQGVVFAKTTMHEESDAGAYTHGTKVFFGEVIMRYATDERQNYREYFRSVFVHELFHCLTRNNPDFRRDMYALLGFTVVDEDFDFAPKIAEAIISNPDVEHHNSYAAFDIGGERINCTVVFTSKPFEQPGDSFFDDMRTGLVPIDDTSVMYDSDEAANFWDVFGRNTDYVIDPEETLADNFALAVVYGPNSAWPTPELIDAIDACLKGR